MAFFSQDDAAAPSDPSVSFWGRSDDDNQDFPFGGAADAFGGESGSPMHFGSPAPAPSPSGRHFPMSPARENGDESPAAAHQWQGDKSTALDVSEIDSGFGNQTFDFGNPSSPPVFDNQNTKGPEFSFDASPEAAFDFEDGAQDSDASGYSQEDWEEAARGENAGHQMEDKSGWVASDTEAGLEDNPQPTKTSGPVDELAVDSSLLHVDPSEKSKAVEVYAESCRQFLLREEQPPKRPNKPQHSRNHAELSRQRGAPPKKHSKAELETKSKSANPSRSEHRKDRVLTNCISSHQGSVEEKSRKRLSDAKTREDLLDFIPRHLDSKNTKPKAKFDDILETSDCKPNKAARSRSCNSAGDLNCRQLKPTRNPAHKEKLPEERPQRQPTGSQTPMRKQPTVNLGLDQSSKFSKMVARPPTPPKGYSPPRRSSSSGGQPRGKTAQTSAVSEASGEAESMTPAVFLQNMGPELRDILKSEFLRAQQSRNRQEKMENDLRQLLTIAVKYRDLLAKRKADLITQLDQVLQQLKNP